MALVDLLSGKHDRADDGDQNQKRRDFEGQQVIGKKSVADLLRAAALKSPNFTKSAFGNQRVENRQSSDEQRDQRGHAQQLRHPGSLASPDSAPAFSSMITKMNSTMIAPA